MCSYHLSISCKLLVFLTFKMLHVVVFCLEIFREMRTSLISVSELVFSLDKQREKKGCLRCKLNRCHFACKTKFTGFFFCFAKKIFRENEVEFYVSKWDIFNFIFWPRAFFFIQLCHKKYSVHEKYLCTCISLYDISCLFFVWF